MNFFASMKTIRLYILIAAASLGMLTAGRAAAQDPEAQREKEMYEALEMQLDRMTDLLDLEDWQVFYVDSIMTHDYKAMQDELQDLQQRKVSNTDIYYSVQYTWMDKMYYAFEKVFNEDQWAKYLKSGAARDKKRREKFFDKKK